MTDGQGDSAVAQHTGLAEVRAMTSAMLEAVEQRRWADVQRLDEARTKLLHGLPAAVFASGDPDVRATLGDALEATGLIQRRLADARDEIGRQLKQHNQRQQAADAYRTAR